jgi:hypothetical protein
MDQVDKDRLLTIEKIVRARNSYINFLRVALGIFILGVILILLDRDPLPIMLAFLIPLFAYAIIRKKFSSPPCPYCGQPNCLFRTGPYKFPSKNCTRCGARIVN